MRALHRTGVGAILAGMTLVQKIDPDHLPQPQPLPLPKELREPPLFEPQNMSLEALAQYFAQVIQRQSGLPCEAVQESIGGEIIPVVFIHVPADVERPHRVFAAAINLAHEQIERVGPELTGRVALEFVKDKHAA